MDLFTEIEKKQLNYDNFLEELDQFLSDKSSQNKNTLYTYKFALKFFYTYASKRNLDFSKETILKYKSYLEKSRKMKKYAISTYLTSLRQFFEYEVINSKIDSNPLKELKYKIKNRTVNFEYLTEEQVKQLYASITNDGFINLRDLLIIKLIITFNLDENILININLGDVEHNKRKIVIRIKDKSKENKILEIPKELFKDMENYLQLKSFSFANQALFTSKSNRSFDERITKRGLREMFENRLYNSKLILSSKKISPIILKHTAGVLMAKQFEDIDKFMYAANIQSYSTAEKYFNAAKIKNI